jgi:hypothetical protein
MTAVDVRDVLDRAAIRFALIGAAAVALRGHPRFTQDTDFFTTDHRVFQASLWEELARRGEAVEIRKAEPDDPIGGVVRIGSLPNRVDVVVGKWKWERAILERSEQMDAFGGVLVPSRSDLILLKLAAGGYKDLVDAAALLSLGPQDEIIAEVNARIADLPEDAQSGWKKMLSAMG